MSDLIKTQYSKAGAIFADGTQAYTDKNSLHSEELSTSISDNYATMLTNGVLLTAVYFEWDQSSQTLSVCKNSTSYAAYEAAVTFNREESLISSEAAGWTYIGNQVTPSV